MVLIVAEIGLNYNGNFDLAYELIRQAKWAGADIVKFQLGWRSNPGDINFIDLERLLMLKNWCFNQNIELMVSIFTSDALELAKEVDFLRYKIASRTVNDDFGLCIDIIKEAKETFISLGMWDKSNFPFGLSNDKVKYIYCISKYPTFAQDMEGFPKKFSSGGFYGYSDHMIGIEGCLLAVARGALYIEKHFTLDKTSSVIRDHVLSATPNEFRELTITARALSNLFHSINQK